MAMLDTRKATGIIAIAAAIVAVMFGVTSCGKTVEPGNAGVKIRTLGTGAVARHLPPARDPGAVDIEPMALRRDPLVIIADLPDPPQPVQHHPQYPWSCAGGRFVNQAAGEESAWRRGGLRGRRIRGIHSACVLPPGAVMLW